MGLSERGRVHGPAGRRAPTQGTVRRPSAQSSASTARYTNAGMAQSARDHQPDHHHSENALTRPPHASSWIGTDHRGLIARGVWRHPTRSSFGCRQSGSAGGSCELPEPPRLGRVRYSSPQSACRSLSRGLTLDRSMCRRLALPSRSGCKTPRARHRHPVCNGPTDVSSGFIPDSRTPSHLSSGDRPRSH